MLHLAMPFRRLARCPSEALVHHLRFSSCKGSSTTSFHRNCAVGPKNGRRVHCSEAQLGNSSFLSKGWCHLKQWNLPRVWIILMLHHQDQVSYIKCAYIYVYIYIYIYTCIHVYISIRWNVCVYTSTPYVRIKYSPYTCVCIWCIYFLCIHVYMYKWGRYMQRTIYMSYYVHIYIYINSPKDAPT